MFAVACREAKVVKRTIARAEPQVSATVITIQTILQPQKKSLTHAIVIADGLARSGDEMDRWRLFDLEHNRVTVVDDVARTYYTEDLRVGPALQPADASRLKAGSTFTPTGARKVIQGVEATQYLMRLGGYQRELWFGSPAGVPANLFTALHGSDDPISKVPGFPLVDHAELPYGKTKMIVDRSVVRIEQRRVPQSWLRVRSDYKEITAPDANRPPASSPRPNRSIPAAE